MVAQESARRKPALADLRSDSTALISQKDTTNNIFCKLYLNHRDKCKNTIGYSFLPAPHARKKETGQQTDRRAARTECPARIGLLYSESRSG
jgi:hypothetical protein